MNRQLFLRVIIHLLDDQFLMVHHYQELNDLLAETLVLRLTLLKIRYARAPVLLLFQAEKFK